MLITHDDEVAARAERVVVVTDGRLTEASRGAGRWRPVSIVEVVRFAVRGLVANRLRSLLTMLGIIIGIAAVILLTALGNGASQSTSRARSRAWAPTASRSSRASRPRDRGHRRTRR